MIRLLLIKQDAVVKDTLEKVREPNLDMRAYLHNAYVHRVFKSTDIEREAAHDEENTRLVTTKRTSQCNSNTVSTSNTPRHGSEAPANM